MLPQSRIPPWQPYSKSAAGGAFARQADICARYTWPPFSSKASWLGSSATSLGALLPPREKLATAI